MNTRAKCCGATVGPQRKRLFTPAVCSERILAQKENAGDGELGSQPFLIDIINAVGFAQIILSQD